MGNFHHDCMVCWQRKWSGHWWRLCSKHQIAKDILDKSPNRWGWAGHDSHFFAPPTTEKRDRREAGLSRLLEICNLYSVEYGFPISSDLDRCYVSWG